jgi:hypothetical protein
LTPGDSEIENLYSARYTDPVDERFTAFPHRIGDPGEIAFFPLFGFM